MQVLMNYLIRMSKKFVINTEAAIYKDGKWLVGVRAKNENEAPELLSFVGGTVEYCDSSADTLESAIIRYRFWKYILVTAIAEIPFAIITIRASDALISFQPYEFLGWLAVLCIIVGACSYIFRRRRHGIIES